MPGDSLFKPGNVLKACVSNEFGEQYVMVTEEFSSNDPFDDLFRAVTLKDINHVRYVGQVCEWSKGGHEGNYLWRHSSLEEVVDAK